MSSKIALTDISVRAIKAPARGQLTIWDKLSPIAVGAFMAYMSKNLVTNKEGKVFGVIG
jgi:hypothetical protein